MNKINGFTLIELVMIIVLTGIIAAVSSQLISVGFNAYLTGKNVADGDWQAQVGLERMVRDIRSVRSPGDISTASASQFTFTNTSNVSISYSLSSTNLMRNSQVLANGISSLSFNYYDENGASTSTLSLIRFVRITLGISQGNSNFSLYTAIYPRNLP